MIRKAEIKDLKEIASIYNYEVLNNVSTFDVKESDRLDWFNKHNNDERFPLFVYEMDGVIAGYVALSPYRAHEAYYRSVELSLYIKREFRGKKIASALMEFIIKYAKKCSNIHIIISVITAGNDISIHLHEKYGFDFCGRIKEVGFKFDRYLDIDNYVLIV